MRKLLLLLSLLAGCGYSSPYMHESGSPILPPPPPNGAVVVFLRPSAQAYQLGITILDEQGHFLGQIGGGTRFAVALPPGKHVFLGWAENTAALRADLAPGRTYFVEVSPRMGFLSARIQLLGITPRSPSWAQRDEWMREATPLISDQAAGQAEMNRRAGDVAERLQRARQILGEYNQEELAERTIYPQDGI